MIIDAHVHVGVSTAYNFSANADDLLRLADENGIDKLFVTDFTALVHDMREGNDALGKAVRLHPDRILGYVSIPTMKLRQWRAGGNRPLCARVWHAGYQDLLIPEDSLGAPFGFSCAGTGGLASHADSGALHGRRVRGNGLARAGGIPHDGALRQHGAGAGRLDARGAGCGTQSFTSCWKPQAARSTTAR